MKEYKIRVNNEAESKEAQELFFELGYVWRAEKNKVSYLDEKYIFAESDGYLTYSSNLSTFNKDEGQEITLPQLRELAKPQGELISGADAKLAWAKGENVEYKNTEKWNSLHEHNSLGIFDRKGVVFRLKPRTVKLEIEVPKPFEPKVGDTYFYLSADSTKGYMYKVNFLDDWDKVYIQYGAWRTEADIKIVVEQFRKLKELWK